LGGLAVVITPQIRCSELQGRFGALERLLAASDHQEAIGQLAAFATKLTSGRGPLDRSWSCACGAHL
jgi:hypothetical protein